MHLASSLEGDGASHFLDEDEKMVEGVPYAYAPVPLKSIPRFKPDIRFHQG